LILLSVTLLAACSGPPPASGPPAQPASSVTQAGRTPGSLVVSAPATGTTAAGGCPIFPADNVWHADVSGLPVRADSGALIAAIGDDASVHPDFGSGVWDGGPIGIPITKVAAGQPVVKVTFVYSAESDKGGYPIPRDATIEGGPQSDGDRHVIVWDTGRCKAYEVFAAYPQSDGSWRAGSGAIFDLRSNALRPKGWTSADAAGLSILAGLVRYEEVAAGHIDHAIRVTVPRSADAFVWPARHSASDRSGTLPPMGLRLRLKASVDLSPLPRQARIVAEAMKKYGVIVADNGSPWYISGAPDARWSNDALHALGGLHGNDFEVVDTSGMAVSPDSAAVRR
jgi:hypothetical protein